MANIYKVYIDDPAAGDVAVWTMEAASPASAISKVMQRVSYGKNDRVESFEVSAELEVRNMTYAEYKSRRTMLALDGWDSATSEQFPTLEVLSTLQGESTPANCK